MRTAISRARRLAASTLVAGVVAGTAGVALAGPAGATTPVQPDADGATASAQAPSKSPADAGTTATTVQMRADIDRLPLRSEPHQGAGPSRYPGLLNEATQPGLCWTEGQHVNAWGVSHNKWVRVRIDAPGYPGYYDDWVWGGGLKGSETGNVPNHC